jgi:two-component system CheB/CheR fusion protein
MTDKEAGTSNTDSRRETNPGLRPARTTFPVVGIGASAGGLEACQLLLKELPANLGMAYVFLPHLDPSRESAFREILARSTAMPVLDATNGIQIAPNNVYVIPRNCEMTTSGGVLHLTQREQPRSVHMTVDIFLRSLAADLGRNAIGVVLSGTASDGTMGVTAIKGEGGITFAQDSSAKYDGMPTSAIASGSVDLVLPPEGIAHELTRIAGHPYVSGDEIELEEEIGETKEAQMAQVFALLRRATQVDFSEYKPPTIGRRVARRMALHKVEKLSDYVALLQRDKNEIRALHQDLLINVTSFFRDPEAFEALKRVVYADLLKDRENTISPIRIWVPGCSTGEETYSHAISLMEFLGEERTEIPIQIFGTDLSDTAVGRARSGLYKETIEADVSPIRLRRFFHLVDSGYQISKTIRDLCVFSTQNVFSDPPFSRIDLVSCRNVMIYLSQALQRRVIPVFHYALNPGGFLMIGNTEGLLGSGPDLFEMADKKQKIYRKRAVPTPATFRFSVHMAERNPENPVPPVAGKTTEPHRVPVDLQREADRLLLARYAPPSVVVNEQLEIVQTKGHTGAFLELPTGKVSLNLLKMARPGLLFELQNAIDEARKSGIDAVRSNVQVEGDGGAAFIRLRVTPFKTPVQDKSSFLISFEPADGQSAPVATDMVVSPLSDDERTTRDKQIAQLKQELAASKEYLQSIIEALESTNEELQSANEEIQSGNEELQSTNEELQTSKEELESANEELHTVNEEMQHRNELLTQLNNDLTNLLNSVNLPMVMVGPDLSVRRFTPQATKVLGLTATDVGRPITRLRLKVDVANLEQMMLNVIAEVKTAMHRVKDADGNWCDLRLTPYRTADNRIDGVVLSVLAFNEFEESPPRQTKNAAAKSKKNTQKKSSKKPTKRS